MTAPNPASTAIDPTQTPGAADGQRASARRSAAKVTLGQAFVIAQRAGDGDVFAVLLNQDQRAVVLSVRRDSAPGRPIRLSKVTIDLATGAILQLESITLTPASHLNRARIKHMESIPGFAGIAKMPWYPDKRYQGTIGRAPAGVRARV